MAKKTEDFEVQFNCKINPNTLNIDIEAANYAVKQHYLTPFIDEDLVVTIGKKKKNPPKTKAQLGYWFGVIIPQVQRFHKENMGEDLSPQLMHIEICVSVLDVEVKVIELPSGHRVLDIDRFRFSKGDIMDISKAIEKTVLYYAEKGLEIKLGNGVENFNNLSDL